MLGVSLNPQISTTCIISKTLRLDVLRKDFLCKYISCITNVKRDIEETEMKLQLDNHQYLRAYAKINTKTSMKNFNNHFSCEI